MTTFKGLIARHPVASYFALTFGISWSGFVLIVGPSGFPGTGSQFDALVPFVVLAMLAGSVLAAALWIVVTVVAVADGQFSRQPLRRRVA